MCKGKKDCGCGCAPKYGGYTRSMLTYANGGLKKLAFGISDTEPDTEPDPPVTSGLPLFQYVPNQGQSNQGQFDPFLNMSVNPSVSDSYSNIQNNLEQRFRIPATPVLQQSSYVPRSDEEVAAIEQRAAEREAMQNFEQSMSAERIDSSVPGESRQEGLDRVEELIQQQMDQYGPSIKLSDFTTRKDIALLQAFLGSQGYDLNTANKQFTNYTGGQASLSGELFGQNISIKKGKQGYDGKIGDATRKAVQDYNQSRGDQRQRALIDLGLMTEEEQVLYRSTPYRPDGEDGEERCAETGCAEFSTMELSRATGIPREELREKYGLTGDAWQVITNALNAGATQLYSNPNYIDPHSSSKQGEGFKTDFSKVNAGDLVAIKYGLEYRDGVSARAASRELGVDLLNAYTHSALIDEANIDASGNGQITIVHNVHRFSNAEERANGAGEFIGRKYKHTFDVKDGEIQTFGEGGGKMRIMQIVDVLGDKDRESLSLGLVTSEIGKPANYDNYSLSQQLTLDRMTESLNNKDFSAAILDKFPTLSEDELNGLKQATMGVGAQETELSGAFGGNVGRFLYEKAASAARHSADINIPLMSVRLGDLYKAATGKDFDPITGSVGPTSVKIGETEELRDAETNPYGRIALTQKEIDFLNREGNFEIGTGTMSDVAGAGASLYILAREYTHFKNKYPEADQGTLLGYALQAYNSGRGIATSVPVEELGTTRKEYVEERDSDYVNKVLASAVQFPITSGDSSLNTILDREVRENPVTAARGQTKRTIDGERDELFNFVPALNYRAYGGLVGKDSGSGQLDYNPNQNVSTSAYDAGQSTIDVDSSDLEGTTREKIKDVGRTVGQAVVGQVVGAVEGAANMVGADVNLDPNLKFGEMTQSDLDKQQKVGRVAQAVGSAAVTIGAGVATGNPQLIARGAQKTFDNIGNIDPNSKGLQTVSNVGQAGAQIYGMTAGMGTTPTPTGGGAPLGTTSGVDAAGNAVSYAPGANPQGTGSAFGDKLNEISWNSLTYGIPMPMRVGGPVKTYAIGGPTNPPVDLFTDTLTQAQQTQSSQGEGLFPQKAPTPPGMNSMFSSGFFDTPDPGVLPATASPAIVDTPPVGAYSLADPSSNISYSRGPRGVNLSIQTGADKKGNPTYTTVPISSLESSLNSPSFFSNDPALRNAAIEQLQGGFPIEVDEKGNVRLNFTPAQRRVLVRKSEDTTEDTMSSDEYLLAIMNQISNPEELPETKRKIISRKGPSPDNPVPEFEGCNECEHHYWADNKYGGSIKKFAPGGDTDPPKIIDVQQRPDGILEFYDDGSQNFIPNDGSPARRSKPTVMLDTAEIVASPNQESPSLFDQLSKDRSRNQVRRRLGDQGVAELNSMYTAINQERQPYVDNFLTPLLLSGTAMGAAPVVGAALEAAPAVGQAVLRGANAIPGEIGKFFTALNTPLTIGSNTVPGLTMGNIVGTGFGIKGAYNLDKDLTTGFYNNPSIPTSQKVERGAITTLDFLGFPGMGNALFQTGKGAFNLGKQGLNQTGKFLTTQTPLKNAWRLNPNAYQYNLPQNTLWRGIGKEGMQDALQSGVFRSKPNVEPYGLGSFDLAKIFDKTYYSPRFKVADSRYGAGYIAEVPRDAANFGRRYKHSNWSMATTDQIPINKGRILQKDWLRGYKPVNLSNPGTKPFQPKAEPTTLSTLDFTRPPRPPRKPRNIQEDNFKLGNFDVKKTYKPNTNLFDEISLKGESGHWNLMPNKQAGENAYYFSANMTNPVESGRAMLQMNKLFPLPKPTILEPKSLSLDSYNALLNLGKRKDWVAKFEGYIPLNMQAKHNSLIDDLIPNKAENIHNKFIFNKAQAQEAVNRVNQFLLKKGITQEAKVVKGGDFYGIHIPNFRLQRQYQNGGPTDPPKYNTAPASTTEVAMPNPNIPDETSNPFSDITKARAMEYAQNADNQEMLEKERRSAHQRLQNQNMIYRPVITIRDGEIIEIGPEDPYHPKHQQFIKDQRLVDPMSQLSFPKGYSQGGSVNKQYPEINSYEYGGGLRRWFKEEWKDVKTGEPCGRSGKDKSTRAYPYCRPSKKVSSETPATSSHSEAESRAKQKTGPGRVKPIQRKS